MQKIRTIVSISMLGACLAFSGCGAGEDGAAVSSRAETDPALAEKQQTEAGEEAEAAGQLVYRILDRQKVESDFSTYGELQKEHEEFRDEEGQVYYYYDMECACFPDTFPDTVRETLQTYYDTVREQYKQDAQIYEGGEAPDGDSAGEDNTPYDALLFQYVTYAGEDYVSLVCNNVSYLGGAHPYSALDGITIDCETGEILPLEHFLDASEEEIRAELERLLELDAYSPEEWDYYITEDKIVLFYYDPRFWDSVEIKGAR